MKNNFGKYLRISTLSAFKEEILFIFLKNVKLSGFDRVVKKLLNQGKTYIGVSAGSYIACPTIEQSYWRHKYMDKATHGVKDISALNLVPFLISTHFIEKYRKTVTLGAKSCKYPVVALYDTQAVLVEDGKWKVIGSGKHEFFNGFKEGL